ncbi:MAG: PEP-CTERM sorting domain-containing protein [Armatimonadetes bacterium]|nr:PEP-CTERM sorting domain-containing protein [Armatimonadota bacterium]
MGFRIAEVPEPSSLIVLAGCLGTILGFRLRRL